MTPRLEVLSELKATLAGLASLLQEGVLSDDDYKRLRDSVICGVMARLQYNK